MNEELAGLDWTKSTSHTLSGHNITGHFEEEHHHLRASSNSNVQKLGGTFNSLVTAHASSKMPFCVTIIDLYSSLFVNYVSCNILFVWKKRFIKNILVQ